MSLNSTCKYVAYLCKLCFYVHICIDTVAIILKVLHFVYKVQVAWLYF